MNTSRYQYVCAEAKAGRDTFIRHTESGEEGRVSKCVTANDHVIVETPQGETRCWDYNACEEVIDPRSRPMV
ncbi:MAG: hypothetical protein P8Y91_10090 [Desulfuromonadales bacterium]|jgi:hypothetical protein